MSRVRAPSATPLKPYATISCVRLILWPFVNQTPDKGSRFKIPVLPFRLFVQARTNLHSSLHYFLGMMGVDAEKGTISEGDALESHISFEYSSLIAATYFFRFACRLTPFWCRVSLSTLPFASGTKVICASTAL